MNARTQLVAPERPAEQEPVELEPGGPNAIAVALGIVGDEWTLQVLRAVLSGARRFNQIAAALPISDAVLSSRLANAVRAGLLQQVDDPEPPAASRYVLTARGHSLWPVLVAIWSWEADWVPASSRSRSRPLPGLVHVTCGQVTAVDLACTRCEAATAAADVTTRLGPSGDWSRFTPTSGTRRRRSVGEFPQTMALIGNRWSAALLGATFLGVRRFTDLQVALSVPPSTLADRIHTFVDLEVLREHDDGYHLTSKGLALAPVVLCAIAWGQHWWRAPDGPALIIRHDDHEMVPALACRACGEVVLADDVEAGLGGGRWARGQTPDTTVSAAGWISPVSIASA